MTNILQPPRGTYDAMPEKSRRLRFIENTFMKVVERYGYGEIRTPVFEPYELFARNVGDATDIVTKEMYVFEDRGGEKMALRPEGTAPVARAYYTHGLKTHLPVKLAYAGIPTFRYERPQKGRYRQHHQLGVECFGIAEPWADVEVMALGVAFLQEIGLDNLYVEINTLGDTEDRNRYRQALLDYFEPIKDQLSKESQERLQVNPLRVLDSKQKEDQPFVLDAPKPVDYLSEESTAFYNKVKEGLDALGINYKEASRLVRGLDYYSHTVFEVHSEDLGAQSQVLSGGRYDGLIGQIGNDDVAGVGFGAGTERVEMLLAEMEALDAPIVFVVMDDVARIEAMRIAEILRKEGKIVAVPLVGQSMKAQFKKANKIGASHVVIIGENELEAKTVQIKNMETGEQNEIAISKIVSVLA